MRRVPRSLGKIIAMSPTVSIKFQWRDGVIRPHIQNELCIYMLGKVEGDLIMVGEHAPSSNELVVYMRHSVLIPKISLSKWAQSNTVCWDIEEFSMHINILGGGFYHLPRIRTHKNIPLSPLDGVQKVTLWAHPLVDLH